MSIESSPEGDDPQKALSVYDFVYVDHERIASVLSQFDDMGSLTKLTQSHVRRGIKRGEAGIPGIGKGQVEAGNDESQGREYDPLWLAPLNFLDQLTVHQALEVDLPSARIGQFVMISGALSVADLTLLKEMWGNPIIKKSMMAQAAPAVDLPRGQRRSQGNTKAKVNDEVELSLSILGMMPHYLQATIGSGAAAAWFNMEPRYMKQPVGDFTLKHGGYIPGEWHVVGLLDARPEDDDTIFDVPNQNMLAAAFQDLALPVRFMMGRPLNMYGITPVVVFRQAH